MGGRRPLHRWSRRLVATAVLLAGVLGPSRARAESPEPAAAEPFRMIWTSPAGCGDAKTFMAELNSRTSRLRPARDGEHAIALRAELLVEATGVHGRLTVRKTNGEVLTREVPGRTCQEVVSAMALIAALMVDPLALTSESDVVTPEPPAAAPPPPPGPPAKRNWMFGLEQRLTARTAVAPHLAWGEAVGLMVMWQSNAFRPSLELSAHRVRASTSRSFGSADLTWTAAQLSLCPWGAKPGPRWDARACALLQIGRLLGTGYETPNRSEGTIFWSGLGLQLEGRVELGGPLWLGLEAAILRPFSRESFYLAPSQTLHAIPAWGASFGAGLGLLFF